MTREQFYTSLLEILQDAKPGQDLSTVTPQTHLWRERIIDSLMMMEIVTYLEESLELEIDLRGDFLENFTTMSAMYDAYVAG